MIKNKLKITYIAPRFYPYKSGAEGNLLAMAERMAANGHDVTVLTTDFKFRDLKPLKYEEYKGIKIHRLWSRIEDPVYLAFTPGLFWKLLRSDADIIHVSGFGFVWFEFCLFWKKLFNRKSISFINTPHGPFMASDGRTAGIRGTYKKAYDWILKKYVPRVYDKIIAVVPKQSDWLEEMYDVTKDMIAVIPNGIEEDYVTTKKPSFKKDQKVVITYLNRMLWYKGIQTVLQAIAKLDRQEKYRAARKDLKHTPLPPFEFWIMGRPTKYTENLKRLIEEHELEKFTKFVFTPSDGERDRIFLEDSQINILPSKWEATGIALIEAMAKGNAIITTYQNEAHDLLIKEGESGFVFNFGDVDKLTDILRNLLEDFELRQKIILHNIEFSKEFTWEAIFPKYEALVVEMASLTTKE